MTDFSDLRQIRSGRGAAANPANRFERVRLQADPEQWDSFDPPAADDRPLPTEFFPDASRSILAENQSPDIPFRYSINPYRGCEHGCAYCYARPTHETLGFNAGLDFESRILVKHEAPALLREALCRPGWQGELIGLSGVTDCYQPIERQLRLTRQLLEVLVEARQCVGIVTKNALVLRDLDLLKGLAAEQLVQVNLSITTLDAELARRLEPRTSAPAARLRAVAALAEAGVPVRVLVAPIIPGLNDHEAPAVLSAAREAGAHAAGYQLLRLPGAVLPVFDAWLAAHLPDRRERILARIRETRGGQLNDAEFDRRMRGQGPYAEQIAATFRVVARKLGLDRSLPPPDTTRFRPPRDRQGQGSLF